MSFEETLRLIVREEVALGLDRLKALAAPAQPAANGDRLLRPQEAERLTGYNRETIKRWARQGVLARYGTQRGLRVSESELMAFLARGQNAAKSAPTDAQIIEMARRKAVAK